jgi:TolB-like protein/Tfp pilus assembly protein PilF
MADVRVTDAADRAPRLAGMPRSTAAAVALVVLAAIVGVALLERRTDEAVTVRKPSVAVLPLQNMSAEPANEYFSDGMTEEITSKLSRITTLEVAARTSAARFKGTKQDVKEVGRELGVRYVLEGSVRKDGDRVRINVQLVDTASGFHLWGDDFDGELKDVFAVQERTALKIADALQLNLTPQEHRAVTRSYTRNAAAYDAYLRGYALSQNFDNPEQLEAARAYFERALSAEADYAPALAEIAHVEAWYYRNIGPDPARLQRAEQLAGRALALDPQLAVAHSALGQVYGDRYDYHRAESKFREALALQPDLPREWMLLAWSLTYQQPPRPEEAERAAREAIGLQPNLASAYYQLGRALTLQSRWSEAQAAFDYSRKLDPAFQAPLLGMAQVYLGQGQYAEAEAQIRRLLERRDSQVGRVLLAQVLAARGNATGALDSIERALRDGYADYTFLESSEYLASIRSTPRYHQLLRRYGGR